MFFEQIAHIVKGLCEIRIYFESFAVAVKGRFYLAGTFQRNSQAVMSVGKFWLE